MLSQDSVEIATNSIRTRLGANHWILSEPIRVAMILGSGLGALAQEIERPSIIPYSEIPGFPLSHVAGHAGNLVIGRMGHTSVAALAGRSHLYEGWKAPHATLPLRVLARLGAEELVVSNASGGINPRFTSGQVVLIDQHIDCIRRSPFLPEEADPQTLSSSLNSRGQHRRKASPYDPSLMDRADRIALRMGFSLSRGTYLATLGPTYETRAEYRMFARMGADMVGMSTVPEVMVANHLGIKVLAFSIVTNVAKPDAPTKTDHAEVLDWSKQAQSKLIPLIKSLYQE